MTLVRTLIWSQHLLGSGHLMRSLLIAEAIAKKDGEVTLISGGPPLSFPIPDGVNFLQLPVIQAGDRDISTLVDVNRNAVTDALWEERGAMIERTIRETPFNCVLTEMFPFGRRAFRSEIRNLLDNARAADAECKVMASVRDILVSKPHIDKYRWMVEWVQNDFDEVLVHSDPGFIRFDKTFPLAAQIEEKLRYTGYIARSVSGLRPEKRSGVVISAGGGAVGQKLIDAALMLAQDRSGSSEPWTIVAGGRADVADLRRWRKMASQGIEIEQHVDNLPTRIAQSSIAISQAGYNTVAETLAAGTPMLLVPFWTSGEDEQQSRANAIEGAGLGIALPEAELTPQNLADGLKRARKLQPGSNDVSVNGAEMTAERILQCVRKSSHAN